VQVPNTDNHRHVCETLRAAQDETLIHRDELWTATLSGDVPGWVMLIANRHSDDWLWGLTPEESTSLGPMLVRLSSVTRQVTNAERIYLMSFGENTQHFHLLLLSRFADTSMDARGIALLGSGPNLANAIAPFTSLRSVALRSE
jgi:diadenosine tetraphosphate (Ap4A) HIT family hydrolase